jgi:hypothetical protein
MKETVGRITGIGRFIPIGQLCRIGRFPNQQVEGSIPSWRALASHGLDAGCVSGHSGRRGDSAKGLQNTRGLKVRDRLRLSASDEHPDRLGAGRHPAGDSTMAPIDLMDCARHATAGDRMTAVECLGSAPGLGSVFGRIAWGDSSYGNLPLLPGGLRRDGVNGGHRKRSDWWLPRLRPIQ